MTREQALAEYREHSENLLSYLLEDQNWPINLGHITDMLSINMAAERQLKRDFDNDTEQEVTDYEMSLLSAYRTDGEEALKMKLEEPYVNWRLYDIINYVRRIRKQQSKPGRRSS